MIEILLLVHKVLLIVTVVVLGASLLFYGIKMLVALASSARDSFRAEPYYSGFHTKRYRVLPFGKTLYRFGI